MHCWRNPCRNAMWENSPSRSWNGSHSTRWPMRMRVVRAGSGGVQDHTRCHNLNLRNSPVGRSSRLLQQRNDSFLRCH